MPFHTLPWPPAAKVPQRLRRVVRAGARQLAASAGSAAAVVPATPPPAGQVLAPSSAGMATANSQSTLAAEAAAFTNATTLFLAGTALLKIHAYSVAAVLRVLAGGRGLTGLWAGQACSRRAHAAGPRCILTGAGAAARRRQGRAVEHPHRGRAAHGALRAGELCRRALYRRERELDGQPPGGGSRLYPSWFAASNKTLACRRQAPPIVRRHRARPPAAPALARRPVRRLLRQRCTLQVASQHPRERACSRAPQRAPRGCR